MQKKKKARDVKDNSLRVPHGEGGRVVDVKVFDREKGDELPPGANTVIRVYIAQKRKVSVGDKLSGRTHNMLEIVQVHLICFCLRFLALYFFCFLQCLFNEETQLMQLLFFAVQLYI